MLDGWCKLYDNNTIATRQLVIKMKVTNITQYDDGSTWAASVEIQGFIICAVLVANEIRVHQVARRDKRTAPKWAIPTVKKWAAAEVAKLSPEWMAKHSEMYA